MTLRRWIGASVLAGGLMTTAMAQSPLTFDVVNGDDAQYLEKKRTGVMFYTTLWLPMDRVLLLQYRDQAFLLNTEPFRSGHIAVRLTP